MRVYVALLEKVEALRGGCFENDGSLPSKGKKWIVMGHFDAMRTYELDMTGKTLFEAMRDSNKQLAQAQRSDRYLHPLYLIAPEEDGARWFCDDPFLAIARVHFSRSVDANATFLTVSEKLKAHEALWGCSCTCFRTVELSDMILAISAKKLSSVLNFVLTLRTFPEVGKVYTYAGVEYDRVKQTDHATKPAADESDSIDLFSIRFSVKSFAEAQGALDRVREILDDEREYSVAGVDDVVITWNDLPVHNLLALYREWFNTENGPLQRDCFSDVTTRVGVSLDKLEVSLPTAPDESVQALQMRCEDLKDRCKKIPRKEAWAAPLSSLLDTMVRMSHTSVLDEFVYIMYEGVHAFLENVKGPDYRIQSDEENDDAGGESRFVENLGLLMEHVIRVEGQLTHNPELRPVVYDIPVAMLEYTLAFLQKVSAILQSKDRKKVKISFLLVPRLCERMKALELFQASETLPGLVLVTIPVGSMYEPETIQRELCHEISHFVGEHFRNREIRRQLYGYAAAALAAREFFLSDHPALIRTVWQGIQKELDQAPAENHMRQLTDRIANWAHSLLDNETGYRQLIYRALLASGEGSIDRPLELSRNVAFFEEARVSRFCRLLEDLHTLFRETYADVCLLFLLPVRLDQYLASHVQELRTEPVEQERPYEQYAIRLYVAIKAVDRENELQWDELKRLDPLLYNEMKHLKELIEIGEEKISRLIPIVSVLDLLRYAKTCYENIQAAPEDKRKELRQMFQNIVPEKGATTIDYKTFLRDIDDYRKELLRLK